MRINNNITAKNAHRNLAINNSTISKSVEKLSSGLRINRSADDAAGLAISEKMRAQIRGLNMASKNSQDAISLVQTAEGALQSSHNVLQRMRELAVQSASDTNEKVIDRGALQAEFGQLQQEIDDIASKTVFNDQKLIDGTFQKYRSILKSSTLDNIQAINVTNAFGGDYEVVVTSQKAIPASYVTGKAASFTATKANNSLLNSSTYTAGSALDSLKITFMGLQTDAHNGNKYSVRVTGNNLENMTFQLIDSNNNLVSTAISVDTTSWNTSTANSITFEGIGTLSITLNNKERPRITGTDELELFNGKSIEFNADGKNREYSNGQPAFLEVSVANEIVRLYKGDTSANFKNAGIVLNFGNPLSDADIIDPHVLGTATPKIISVASGRGSTMIIQTGANQGDELSVNIKAMNTAVLGIRFSDISDRAKASSTLTDITDAINKVSAQRADLGALQNRLEYRISNLDVSAENLNAAESRIRDVDMAKEMTTFSKQNILSQASTAMLAQANALPQGVLQLIGG